MLRLQKLAGLSFTGSLPDCKAFRAGTWCGGVLCQFRDVILEVLPPEKNELRFDDFDPTSTLGLVFPS